MRGTPHELASYTPQGYGCLMRATASWGMAAQATLHCLTGCAIGEVLGMVIGTATGLHNAGTVALSIVLAFAFGYGLTMSSVLRQGVGVRAALGVALAADTVSIIVMELIDNAIVVAIPGALNAGLGSVLFWGSLVFSLVIAFLLTTPVNKWLIGRGKGHAVMHAYHRHGQVHGQSHGQSHGDDQMSDHHASGAASPDSHMSPNSPQELIMLRAGYRRSPGTSASGARRQPGRRRTRAGPLRRSRAGRRGR